MDCKSSVGDVVYLNSDNIYNLLKNLTSHQTAGGSSSQAAANFDSFEDCQRWWRLMRLIMLAKKFLTRSLTSTKVPGTAKALNSRDL